MSDHPNIQMPSIVPKLPPVELLLYRSGRFFFFLGILVFIICVFELFHKNNTAMEPEPGKSLLGILGSLGILIFGMIQWGLSEAIVELRRIRRGIER